MSYRPKQGTTTRTYYGAYVKRGISPLKPHWSFCNSFHASQYRGILGALKAGFKYVTTKQPCEDFVIEKRLYKYTVTTKIERVV